MINSMLEITENEYLIKLNRQNFNLSFIRSLLKMVEVANPADTDYVENRFTSRSQVISAEPDYFSSLDEK
jgi:hypothetical protein